MSDEKVVSEEAARADLEARVKGFNEKMIPLLGEFKLGLSATAFLTNDGRISAKPSLVDDSRVEEAKTENAEQATAVTEA